MSREEIHVLTDPRCLDHLAAGGQPESPQRLRGVLDHLERGGWPVSVPGESRRDSRDAVLAVHEDVYLERFEKAVERRDAILDSADNPLSDGTWEAAWAAAGVALAAADRVATSRKPAFAAVRPPGHHAERGTAMGFCFFNNIAVAAQALVDRHGFEKVAIVDFDVHHGNGTQHLFESRGDVFFASLHQYPFYPGTGASAERGIGPGAGATLNLPLPAGSGDEVYARALEEEVFPAIRDFGPDALLLSAGFDAWRDDPLGGMEVSEEAFRAWGARFRELAEEVCGGRLLATLEGGYDLAALPRLVEAHLQGLCGEARSDPRETDGSRDLGSETEGPRRA